jgi:hypothetical protein
MSNKVEDCVFWFKSCVDLPKFKIGSEAYWEMHNRRRVTQSEQQKQQQQQRTYDNPGPVEFHKASNKYKAIVRLLD